MYRHASSSHRLLPFPLIRVNSKASTEVSTISNNSISPQDTSNNGVIMKSNKPLSHHFQNLEHMLSSRIYFFLIDFTDHCGGHAMDYLSTAHRTSLTLPWRTLWMSNSYGTLQTTWPTRLIWLWSCSAAQFTPNALPTTMTLYTKKEWFKHLQAAQAAFTVTCQEDTPVPTWAKTYYRFLCLSATVLSEQSLITAWSFLLALSAKCCAPILFM